MRSHVLGTAAHSCPTSSGMTELYRNAWICIEVSSMHRHIGKLWQAMASCKAPRRQGGDGRSRGCTWLRHSMICNDMH